MIKRGDIFTRLTVIEENVEPPEDKKYAKDIGRWHKCQCNCINHTIVVIPETSLINKLTQSCGCLRNEKAKEQINANREQMIKNKKTTRPHSKTLNLSHDGETKSLTEWADDIGITKQALSNRLKVMSVEKALTKKARGKNGNKTRHDVK